MKGNAEGKAWLEKVDHWGLGDSLYVSLLPGHQEVTSLLCHILTIMTILLLLGPKAMEPLTVRNHEPNQSPL